MKNKKGLKIFLIIIVLIIAILAIHTIRNLIIINKINKKHEELAKTNNYSYIAESSFGVTEYYYKDGISKNVLKTEDSTIITWNNENTNETISYWPKTMKASSGISTVIVRMQTLNSGNNFILALISHIYSDKLNGETCYVVDWKGETTYISKERGVVLKRKGGTIVQNGVETDIVTEFKDWKFNELTDEEMSRPDLTGYEISDIVTMYE